MNTERKKCYIQCQVCGKIFQAQQVPIDTLYVHTYCPRCDKATTGLNLGDKKEDQYYFYNVVLDERYYN